MIEYVWLEQPTGLSCYPDLQCSGFATCHSKAQHTTSRVGCACSRAQIANASGVLISAAAGGDVEVMNCRGEECGLPLSIPAAMIPMSAALQLQVGGKPQPVRGMRVIVLLCFVMMIPAPAA